MCPARLSLGPLRTERLIGRTHEREAIQAAIEAEGELRVIHLIAWGGMGKTRLLEAIEEEILPKCGEKERCRWSGIFDLYHVDIHTNSGLEQAIIKALAPKGFREYRAKRREYERLRSAGGDPRRLEEMRSELAELFIEEFNKITSSIRVILCFDTMELIQYESDVVQEVCDIGLLGIEVRDWLLTVIPRLDNAVVILAGRPKPELWDDLQRQFDAAFAERKSPASQLPIQIGALSYEEVCDYFEDLTAQNSRIAQAALTKDDCHYIHEVTEGKPLRVAFISTLIATKGLPPQKLLPGLAPATVDESLIREMLQLSDDMQIALPCVAWMRKGLDSRLLQQLLEGAAGVQWGISKCGRLLNGLKILPFVKWRHGSRVIWLHDEMYDLMDRHVLSGGGHAEDKAKVCRIAIEYYDNRIAAARGRNRENLMVERLYYQLLASPMQGFNQYRTLSDEAIITHEVGFDMSLRDEVLRFFAQQGPRAAWERIARDSAVRWVERLMRMGNHEKALEVAKRIWRQDRPPLKPTEDDPYYKAAIQIYWNEVSLYLARSRKEIDIATKFLRASIEYLESYVPSDTYQSQNHARLLGWADNVLGYASARLRNYNRAVAEYATAVRWLKRSEFQVMVADAEKNWAFVYAMLGRFGDARNLCKSALERYRCRGMKWGEAMTLNVLGWVEVEDDNPHRARKRCQDALSIFTELDDQRGIGLTSITLGRALRKLGSQDTYLFTSDADDLLEEAEDRLQSAIAIFPRVIDEPLREVEALAEMGRIYRDWAYVYRRRGKPDAPEVQKLEKQAEDCLHGAARTAQDLDFLVEETDAYADLAELCYNRQAYSEVVEWVAQAEKLFPQECILTQRSPAPLEQCPLPQYFLILGKCSLLRGDVSWEHAQQKEEAANDETERIIRGQLSKESADLYRQAVEWWTIAFGYFEFYSPTATTLSLTVEQIYRKLMALSPTQLRSLQDHCHHVEETYGLGHTTLHPEFPKLIEAVTLLRGEGNSGQEF